MLGYGRKKDRVKPMDTLGIEPNTSRMLSGRDKPTTPCALKSGI